MDPARVAKKHDEVTRENGPYMANGSMRTLRAIYIHILLGYDPYSRLAL